MFATVSGSNVERSVRGATSRGRLQSDRPTTIDTAKAASSSNPAATLVKPSGEDVARHANQSDHATTPATQASPPAHRVVASHALR